MEENARPNAKLIAHYRELLARRERRGPAPDSRRSRRAAYPEALQLALPLLDNAGVHAEAEAAVKKIAEAIKAQDPQAAEEALKRLLSKP